MNIARYLKLSKTKPDGYGIEIETESKSDYVVPDFRLWTVHRDDSLRFIGREFVTKGPILIKAVPAALREFRVKTEQVNFHHSVYSSLHVHMNVEHMSWKTYFTFISIWMLLENILAKHCGPDRDGNVFCLKLKNAEGQLQVIEGLLNAIISGQGQGHAFIMTMLSSSASKYSALNLVPLRNLHSIEMRLHGGTTDTNVILDWVNLIHQMRTFAEREDMSPARLIDLYREKEDKLSLITDILPDFDYKKLKLAPNALEENLWYVVSLCLQLESVGKTWDNFVTVGGEKVKFFKYEDEAHEIPHPMPQRVVRRPPPPRQNPIREIPLNYPTTGTRLSRPTASELRAMENDRRRAYAATQAELIRMHEENIRTTPIPETIPTLDENMETVPTPVEND